MVPKSTLPKINSSPEKLPGPNRKVVFQPPFFRGYVNLRGCNGIIFPTKPAHVQCEFFFPGVRVFLRCSAMGWDETILKLQTHVHQTFRWYLKWRYAMKPRVFAADSGWCDVCRHWIGSVGISHPDRGTGSENHGWLVGFFHFGWLTYPPLTSSPQK